jgi:replicative DNA helicase
MVPGSSTQTMSDSELALLGHLIGDGCTLPRHVIQYTTKEQELAEFVAALASEVFGDEISPRISAEHRWLQVYLRSNRLHTHEVHSPITDWLTDLGVFGLRSWEKRIPSRVFEQPSASIAVFLRHLWATDGCIALRKAGTRYTPLLYYATSSENLARDLQSLLLRLEINSLVRRIGQKTKGRDQYHVIITGAGDVGRAIDRIGAVGTRRKQALERIRAWLAAHRANTNRDVIPREIWRSLAVPAMQKAGITTRQMFGRIRMAYCGTKIYGQNISRARAERLGAALGSEEILALAASDLYWDEVTSINPAGTAEVFDLNVPGHHNFIANDFVVHNSIEQDADMVAFIFREEVYRPDKESLKGLAELILAKQRNGPTGRVKLAFLNRYTKFENLAADTGDDEPFGTDE